MRELVRRWLYRRVRSTLRREYRRVIWVGRWRVPPPDRPAILYANHHLFWDGYLLGYLVERVLARRTVIWMEEADRFPFFTPGGVMPFPTTDQGRRVATMLRTRRMMAHDPRTTLVYFPEGSLHSATDGVRIPGDDRCRRVARLLPEALWWPVALRATGPETHRATVALTAAAPHPRPDGGEAGRLEALLAELHRGGGPRRTLLEGRRPPGDRWDFTRIRPAANRHKR